MCSDISYCNEMHYCKSYLNCRTLDSNLGLSTSNIIPDIMGIRSVSERLTTKSSMILHMTGLKYPPYPLPLEKKKEMKKRKRKKIDRESKQTT